MNGPRDHAVPPSRYTAELLTKFAAGEHERYVAAGGKMVRPRIRRALDLAQIRPGSRVLDIGCGRGEVAVEASRLGGRVTALDYSLDALRLSARTISAVEGARGWRVALTAADATRLPLADGTVDRVLMLDVVEHLRPWQVAAALSEVHRILSPTGRVVVHTLPNRWALATAYPLLRMLVPGLPHSPRSDYERAVHVNEQSPRSLRRALERAGFDGRVWVEEWTTTYAQRAARATDGARGHRGMAPTAENATRRGDALRSSDARYPDPQRARGYPVLRRPWVRWLARTVMRTPARSMVGNDIFAVASARRAGRS